MSGRREDPPARDPHGRPRLSAAQLALLPEAIPHLVWVSRPDGSVLYLNRRGRELLGLGPDAESPEAAYARTVHPDDLPRMNAAWEAAVAAGRPFRCVYRVRRDDGSYMPVLSHGNPVRAPDGKVTMWAGTLTDVSGLALDPRALVAELTPRELELLALAADGVPGPEIAARLGVSPATVKRHFENVYAKLGVRDRAAAVAAALRAGLIA